MWNLSKNAKLRRYREGIEVEPSDLWLLVAMFDISAAKDDRRNMAEGRRV